MGQPCEFQVKGQYASDIAEVLWINETVVRKSGLRMQRMGGVGGGQELE
jgi:hypothetical protein